MYKVIIMYDRFKAIISNKCFVKDKNGVIYKYIPFKSHFIKMTHWEIGEDRRVPFKDMANSFENKCAKVIEKKKAATLINAYWDSIEREWNFDGKKYKVLSFNDYSVYVKNKYNIDYFKTHKFKYGRYDLQLYLGWYQGNLVWFIYRPNIERCCMTKFNGIDKTPGIYIIGYTDKKHIKPIIDCETNEFI